MLFEVGGEKRNSSSDILDNYYKWRKNNSGDIPTRLHFIKDYFANAKKKRDYITMSNLFNELYSYTEKK